jgi:flavin-dependent dehydrogenase
MTQKEVDGVAGFSVVQSGQDELSGTPVGLEMPEVEATATSEYDVAIVGAGLGGLAASILLRRAGLRVVCIEPERFPHARVGESLDWSSPALLQVLGLPRDQLIEEKIATYKRNIRLEIINDPIFYGEPQEWMSKEPLKFELKTIHVDRSTFDQRLFEMAQSLGTTFVWDRVTSFEIEDRRVVACQTGGKQRFTASWFIDGSGRARVLAKALHIPKVEYGRRKVCLWTYFKVTPHNEGTTFYGDDIAEYLRWVWEIPITPYETSVGYVMSADYLKELRREGKDVRSIMHDELAKYSRFTTLLTEQPDFQVSTCSYLTYVSEYACDSNWFLVGESASFPDPLTSNGVTAAFRHAREAARYIQESFQQGSLSKRQRYVYNTNVGRMGRGFNHGIETVVYNWPVRMAFGSPMMIMIYTFFAFTINALYTRFQPHGRSSMAIFGFLFAFGHVWIESWSLMGRMVWRAKKLFKRRQPLLKDEANSPRNER